MALFSKKTEGKKTNSPKSERTRVARVGRGEKKDAAPRGVAHPGAVLLRPRITEKASYVTAEGGYTFEVAPRANKQEIKKAVMALYGVTPVRVNTLKIPSKKIAERGRKRGKGGVRAGGKKAIVYLKEGERIEFV